MINQKFEQYIPKNVKAELIGNAVSFEVPALQIQQVASDLSSQNKLSLKNIVATDEIKENGYYKISYIFGVPKENIFIIPYIKIKDSNEFSSIAPIIHVAGGYERKIHAFFGLTPVGNPDPRRIILHENWPTNIFPLRKDFSYTTRPQDANGVYQFQKVEGEGIYEIPVGPIHAGIIEPGHFRFSVAGESIVLLEPRLGFTHKGSEKLFEILLIDEKIKLSEKISGDSSFSHSLAFCQALEQLSNIAVPNRALYLRVLYAELERLANHFGDIGAIMIDTGFSFGGAHGARLREMIMQINEQLTGSRFLRGVNVIGGVTCDLDNDSITKLLNDLTNIYKDFSQVINVAQNSVSLLNRLKGTGVLTRESALNHGVVGVAGRAVGIKQDARFDYPYAAYNDLLIDEIPLEEDGDVYARFNIRIREVDASIKIIQKLLSNLPNGDVNVGKIPTTFKKNSFSVSIIEGWRGEIVYFVSTDSNGNISRVAPRDPSFVNWPALPDAGFDNIVPDFPLINKSFNLSYSGNDL
jgi:Ni,Fe-hydrogenase III large subunit/Ni,Fe-hydrogenase III component G